MHARTHHLQIMSLSPFLLSSTGATEAAQAAGAFLVREVAVGPAAATPEAGGTPLCLDASASLAVCGYARRRGL
jgi:hypothetical protein